jgi:hypothetical protein
VDERKCRDLTWYSTESSVSLRNVEGRWSLGDSPLVAYDVGGGSLEVIMVADAAGGRAASARSDMVLYPQCLPPSKYPKSLSLSVRGGDSRGRLGDSPVVACEVWEGTLGVVMGADAAGGRAAASRSDMVV